MRAASLSSTTSESEFANFPYQANESDAVSGIKRIALAQIALLTLGLKIVVDGLAAFGPGQDMINVQFDAYLRERAGTTRLASKTIPNQNPKSLAIRYLPAGAVPSLDHLSASR